MHRCPYNQHTHTPYMRVKLLSLVVVKTATLLARAHLGLALGKHLSLHPTPLSRKPQPTGTRRIGTTRGTGTPPNPEPYNGHP